MLNVALNHRNELRRYISVSFVRYSEPRRDPDCVRLNPLLVKFKVSFTDEPFLIKQGRSQLNNLNDAAITSLKSPETLPKRRRTII